MKMADNKPKERPMSSTPFSPVPPPGVPLPPGVNLGYDPKGPVDPVDVVSSKEGWSEYTLADGTVIRAKAMLLDARRMVDQFNDQGEPIYVLQLTLINQARVPEKLKKKREAANAV
jgi:hypothetical protein